MKVLGIETSCDDTAIALLEINGSENPEFRLLQNIASSQLEAHAEYGGIVPGLAKREHENKIIHVLNQVLNIDKLEQSGGSINKDTEQKVEIALERYPELLKNFKKEILTRQKPDVDAIAVTHGPGLEPALWVGVNFARALAYAWDIPIIGVDHMEGHIAVNLLSEEGEIEFPALALAVSGGHTQLILVNDWLKYELIGETLDDAAGEAFDKVARLLGLPFPGGPAIQECAKKGDKEAFEFPRPMLKTKDYNFSFSGLKTSVLYTVKEMAKEELNAKKADIAASFQQAVCETLTVKTIRATKEYNARTVLLAGGVAANEELRNIMKERLEKQVPQTKLCIPEIKLATDNGAMIAVAGYLRFKNGDTSNPDTLEANSNKIITE